MSSRNTCFSCGRLPGEHPVRLEGLGPGALCPQFVHHPSDHELVEAVTKRFARHWVEKLERDGEDWRLTLEDGTVVTMAGALLADALR